MNAAESSDFRAEWRSPHLSRSTRPAIGVHVLSEHVFCPRAAIIAQESAPDVGNEEPNRDRDWTCWGITMNTDSQRPFNNAGATCDCG
jgi:hypothetical protein